MKFGTAIIDPPWPYNAGPANGGFSTDAQYSSMSIPQLAKMPVGEVVTDYVFLWCGKAFVEDGFGLMRRWGFEPITWMAWHKHRAGVGSWFFGQTELILLGVNEFGTSPFVRTCLSDTFDHATMKHSRKPDTLHELIETPKESKWFTKNQQWFTGPYLEMFARRRRENWVCVGNELTGNDINTDLYNLLTRN